MSSTASRGGDGADLRFVRSGNDTIWRCGATVAIWPSTSRRPAQLHDPDPGQRPDGVQQRHALPVWAHGDIRSGCGDRSAGGGRFYAVEVRFTAVSATHEVTDIRETAAAAGGYVSPTAFSSGIAAATFLTRLQALSTACTALAGPAHAVGDDGLRATDSTTFTLRRKQQYLYVNYVATGSGTQIRILVNGTTVSNDSTEYPNGVTKTIDLAAVAGGPGVGG